MRLSLLSSVAFTSFVAVAVMICWPRALGAQPPDTTSSPVTYAKEIAPLMYTRCASCHRPGGSAPFGLLRYEDVRDRATLIGEAVARRRMPPWLPEPGYGKFAGERRLSAAEIEMIRQWVVDGAVLGDTADLPAAPSWRDEWELGVPDLVVDLPSYTVPGDGRDLYRNLVAAIPVSQIHYVTAVEIRPGDPKIVHHARMMIDTTSSSSELDALDADPGFDGMDLESDAGNPDGFFLGWTPGKVPSAAPEGMAWRVAPGTDVVLQLHLRPGGEPAIVQPQLGFHFVDAPPRHVPALIMLKSFDIDIPPGEEEYVVVDEYVLPVDVDVLSVYPHAHYLGRELQGFATLPGGRIEWLIHILDWDFNWQDEYRYAEPIPLPAGTVLTMQYTYDNSRNNSQNPNSPPKRVTYGPNSSDEMADLVIQVLPRTPVDLAVLNRDLAWKYEVREVNYLAREQYVLGNALASRGLISEALNHYREGLRLRSDHLGIHVAMARALVSLNELDAATLIAERAAQLSQYGDAGVLGALAAVYAADGKTDLAIKTAQAALERAVAAGEEDLAREMRGRLARYERREGRGNS